MLSIHGRRKDGFHDLTSLVVPVRFGDSLRISPGETRDTLVCEQAGIPLDERNLILQAARAFREETGSCARFAFSLEKRIPVGAGLGGGSSNAAAALVGINRLLGEPLGRGALLGVAARIGSDCALFVDPVPAVMRGRGERVEALEPELAGRLRGRPLVLFGPSFPVSTAWAYGALAAGGGQACESSGTAEARLERFFAGGAPDGLLHNTLEPVVGSKYLAITAMLRWIRQRLNLNCLMSGSGSCCFAFPEPEHVDTGALKSLVTGAWGSEVFWVETSIA